MSEDREYLIRRNIELEEQIGNLTKELIETNHEVLNILQAFEDLNKDMLVSDKEKNEFLTKLKISNKEQLEKIKMQENALIQADKLASLGQLIAGIAHEINNPNTYIRANIELLQKYWRLLEKNISVDKMDLCSSIASDVPNIMNSMYKGTERIMEIISALKAFSKEEKLFYEKININQCIEEAFKLIKVELTKNKVVFINEVSKDGHEINASKQKIEQVLINLFLNSIKAIKLKKEENGQITIFTSEDKDILNISIKDNGCGIKKEHLDMIFNPFFTTHQEDGGTGLGLSIVHGIMKEHGGSIKVQSKIDEGTKFTLIFPKGR
ncbi:sensor histidine kinase [Clostridium beijerinckii]|uniref:sensor histidine kinase n=1 Tax=Clostridium beijerinckii TaxID=1520 RepID=UPI0022E5AA57|nr:ATP-binding protein [Clostridium beijerinckii]